MNLFAPREHRTGPQCHHLSQVTPDSPPTTVPTGMHGLLPTGTVGRGFGRSFTSLQGIHLIPGVRDSDLQRKSKNLVEATLKTVQIHAGQRVTQILL